MNTAKRFTEFLILLAVVLLCAVLLPGREAHADSSGTCGENLTWTLDSEGTLTISGTGAMNNYYPSDSWDPWNTDRSNIQRVAIESGVTSIGNYAFQKCSSLTSVTIPDSVTSIGRGAFSGCSSLTSVTIPDSVTSIGDSAFSNCNSLTSVTIPNGVTSIGDYVFYHSGLTSVEIPNSVTSIGDYAFSDCNLTSVEIPDSVTSIRDHAFEKCYSLENVEIPDSVTSIGDYAFYKSGLRSIRIPGSVESIEDYAFYSRHDGRLQNVTIEEGVLSIGKGAFGGASIESITIPESVTSIGDGAFGSCEPLYEIIIKSPTVDIGVTAFCMGDYSETQGPDEGYNVCYRGNQHLVLPFTARLRNMAFNDHILGLTITGSGPMTKAPWDFLSGDLVNAVVSSGITSIRGQAFLDFTALRSVVIPKTVGRIGDEAFYGCSSLTDVYYEGSEEEWASVLIGFDNDPLQNATVHYNEYPLAAGYLKTRVKQIMGGEYDLRWNEEGPDAEFRWTLDADGCLALYGEGKLPRSIYSDFDYYITRPHWYYAKDKIRSVIIDDGITDIASGTFLDCNNLTDVYYYGSEEEWAAITIWNDNDPLLNATIHYNYQPGAQAPPGDMDGDGEVTESDAIYLLYHTFFPELYPIEQDCDFNGDGEVTEADAIYLLYYTFFPELYPIG